MESFKIFDSWLITKMKYTVMTKIVYDKIPISME